MYLPLSSDSEELALTLPVVHNNMYTNIHKCDTFHIALLTSTNPGSHNSINDTAMGSEAG